jgi:hypothetical protein
MRADFRISHGPKKAGLGKSANAPILVAGCIEPLRHPAVMNIIFLREGDQHVYVG